MLSLDDAIRKFRSDPAYANLVRDAYLGEDALDSAKRFLASSEFKTVCDLIGLERIKGATVLDLGAGVGIASYAFVQSGAKYVYAIEPDESDLVGIGAMQKTITGLPVEIVKSFGESLPLPDSSIDIYYTRQVLHHTQDLEKVMQEAFRVLKPSGVMLACREHVANTPEALEAFLKAHPTHQLAGGEHAYRLEEYTQAIIQSGLQLKAVFGAWDSLINAFPQLQSQEALDKHPATILKKRLGTVGELLGNVPFVRQAIWTYLRRKPTAGALHSFYAVKPT